MSFVEPQVRSNKPADRTTSNTYQGRWRWWYSAIADELLANPRASNKDIAVKMGRSENTISMIRNTDMFKTYYAQRRTEFSAAHDDALRNKVLGVTEASLDVLLDQFKKKGDQVPMKLAADVAGNLLEKLGYGQAPSGPSVAVQVNNGAPQTVVVQGASAFELEAARNALRAAEAQRREPPVPLAAPEGAVIDVDSSDVVEELMEDRQGASSE